MKSTYTGRLPIVLVVVLLVPTLGVCGQQSASPGRPQEVEGYAKAFDALMSADGKRAGTLWDKSSPAKRQELFEATQRVMNDPTIQEVIGPTPRPPDPPKPVLPKPVTPKPGTPPPTKQEWEQALKEFTAALDKASQSTPRNRFAPGSTADVQLLLNDLSNAKP